MEDELAGCLDLPRGSFDGVDTTETFAHATGPRLVLNGFFRVVRPGGQIALFGYDHNFHPEETSHEAKELRYINKTPDMPANDSSNPGVFKEMLEEASFVGVLVRDYSDNIRPMTRLFCVLAYIPHRIITLLGLQEHFMNTVAGVNS